PICAPSQNGHQKEVSLASASSIASFSPPPFGPRIVTLDAAIVLDIAPPLVMVPQSPTPTAAKSDSGVAAIRCFAISQYSGSLSTRMQRRPSRVHATPVVPEPPNGSRTRSPDWVTNRTSQRISAAGLTVG